MDGWMKLNVMDKLITQTVKYLHGCIDKQIGNKQAVK
jgi:hypothetical protein